jgi:prepilin-type N-terminal cleavage/methylation domain-containing protein/prepilin-type processing-associated H-X9-DG protein
MSRRAAFTLVEILVVIAVIAVLLAVLLPALNRSREQARQVVCAGNVRQVTGAFLSYAADNRGRFPGPSVVRPTPQDWIYWQPGRVLNDGRLVRYVDRNFNGDVLRCPSDTLERYASNRAHFPQPHYYRYSYAANQFIVGPWVPPVKVSQIRHATRVILVAEESERTIDDGCWFPPVNQFATRHARPKRGGAGGKDDVGSGNAGFVDGHVETVTRPFAHDARHHVPVSAHPPGPWVQLPGGALPVPTVATLEPPDHGAQPPVQNGGSGQ